MSDIKPELIVKACEVYRRPNRMLTNDSATRHYDCMSAALEAVADDLRAEGAAEALGWVRADIRTEVLIRDAEGKQWTATDVFQLAATYTPEWLDEQIEAGADPENLVLRGPIEVEAEDPTREDTQ